MVTGSDEQLLRRAEVLHLASRDLWDVGICVDHLLAAAGTPFQLHPRVRRTLESGILVTYARPFSGPSSRTIRRGRGLSLELQKFHDEIIDRRNKVYAHTDHTDIRLILNLRTDDAVAAFSAGNDETVLREEADTLTEKGLAWLRELARIHYTECHAEVDRLRVRLGSPETP
jgi:hypothetical protein